PLPECILEADARLVAGNDDRAFDDRRFHHSSPVSIRWRSRSWRALTSRLASSSRSALLRPYRSRLADAVRSASRRSAFFARPAQANNLAHPAPDEPIRGDPLARGFGGKC